jgi:hypothetical protein
MSAALKRLASTLMGHTVWAHRSPLNKENIVRTDEKPKRIEIWETGLSRWNTSGLIFAGIVCVLLYVLSRP